MAKPIQYSKVKNNNKKVQSEKKRAKTETWGQTTLKKCREAKKPSKEKEWLDMKEQGEKWYHEPSEKDFRIEK